MCIRDRHPIEDIKAKKIAEDKGQRLLVRDQNNTLWDYSMEDGSRIETAQNVLDFCYSSANKMYYTSCIWYTTAEKDIKDGDLILDTGVEITVDH